ncbi:MAG: hypothetical protein Sapg2KO_49570 [Saprospiraceae bacterium]
MRKTTFSRIVLSLVVFNFLVLCTAWSQPIITKDKVEFITLEYQKDAIDSLSKQINLALKTSAHENLLDALWSLSNLYSRNDRPEESIEVLKLFISYAEDYNQQHRAGKAMANIGIQLYSMKRYPEAIEALKKAVAYRQDTDSKMVVSLELMYLGRCYQAIKKFEEAQDYLQEALAVEAELEHPTPQIIILEQLALLFMDQQQYPEAISFYERSVALAQQEQLTHKVVSGRLGLAEVYELTGQFNRSMEVLLKNTHNLPQLSFKLQQAYYQRLMSLGQKMGDFRSALQASQAVLSLKDSIHQAEKKLDLKEFQTLAQASEAKVVSKEKLLIEQKNKVLRWRLATGSLLSLSLILGAWAYSIWKSNKQKKLTNELKQKIFNLQMNPHFFFNALTAIQEYIYTGQSKEAVRHLGYLGQLFRKTLEFSRQETITIEEEVGFLKNYLSLQQIRYENGFQFLIDFPEELKQVHIPPMLVQPFVENSLEHGAFSKRPDSQVKIIGKAENGMISIYIEDNGQGFSSLNITPQVEKNKKSLATLITKERLSHLFGKQAALRIESIQDQGTLVHLQIPLNKLAFGTGS